MGKKYEKLERRLEEQEYALEKMEKKTQGQDDLFNQVRLIDQFSKMTETKALNDINNMNNNIELVKEKMRIEQSDSEEHIKLLKNHSLLIDNMHEGQL
jgi:hypothetical protein